jgi:hypothetical protein
MGASRTSNKDVLAAIEALTAAITGGLINAAPAVASVGADDLPSNEGSVNVDPAYLEHMTLKAATHATTKGEEVVLYARKNKLGETKLAYALRSRYDDVVAKQPSCKGAIASFQA